MHSWARSHLHQLSKQESGLAHDLLDHADVGDLAATVEVQKLQAVQHALVRQLVYYSHNLTGAQAKLGTVTCTHNGKSQSLIEDKAVAEAHGTAMITAWASTQGHD